MRAALEAVLGDAAELARSLAVSDISEKADLDYVTNIDTRLDSYLTAALGELTPGVPVVTEERLETQEGLSGRFWIVDPIDGTHNLVAGLPFVAISVALMAADGRAELGAVADLHAGEVYAAERGAGAVVDGRALLPADEPSSLFGVSSGANDDLVAHGQNYRALRGIGKWRNLGSQALHLCYVARGRFGLALSAEARLWDDAAGRLICEEATARYMSFTETSRGQDATISANEPLRSVCGHAGVFERAVELMKPLWCTTGDGE